MSSTRAAAISSAVGNLGGSAPGKFYSGSVGGAATWARSPKESGVAQRVRESHGSVPRLGPLQPGTEFCSARTPRSYLARTEAASPLVTGELRSQAQSQGLRGIIGRQRWHHRCHAGKGTGRHDGWYPPSKEFVLPRSSPPCTFAAPSRRCGGCLLLWCWGVEVVHRSLEDVFRFAGSLAPRHDTWRSPPEVNVRVWPGRQQSGQEPRSEAWFSILLERVCK